MKAAYIRSIAANRRASVGGAIAVFGACIALPCLPAMNEQQGRIDIDLDANQTRAKTEHPPQQQQQQEGSSPSFTNNTSPETPTRLKPIVFPDLRTATRWAWTRLLPWRQPTQSLDWRATFNQQAAALLHHEGYRAMPNPESAMIPTHAIAGALLKEHHIEMYRVYEKQPLTNSDARKITILERSAQAAASTDPHVVALVRVGTQVDGHKGLVHGGILAMIVDDVLGYGFYSIGWPAAFTANLSINYRAPVPAQTTLRIECYFEKQERRKLYWRVCVVDAHKPNKLYADASCLFVVPKEIFEEVIKEE